jgi:uncharacterized cupin superfamily protein
MSESEKYILTADEIEAMPGLSKTHFLNDGAKRVNKSLGDLTGLTGLGFHIIEVQPGDETTEYHSHNYEDECVYVLQGEAIVTIGDTQTTVGEGGFIGYRANGEAHTMTNSGESVLKCIVVGQRLAHEVVDYPRKELRMYNNQGKPWDLVKTADITHPVAGKKS